MNRFSPSPFSRRNFLAGAGAAAVGVSLSAYAKKGWAEEPKKLNVYNWDTYIGQTTLQTFTDKTGIAVQYDLYANNEELFAKLKAGNPGYDVIFPSDYMIETMAKLNMLMALDHSKIPNLANINPAKQFSDPAFNPGLKYGVPYMWGTIGIGYRKSKVQEPKSWKALLDDSTHAGKIALLADARAVLGVALKYLGYSMNSTNEAEVQKAKELLIKQKPSIKAFAPDSGQDMLLSGECDLVMEWNGDIISVMAEDSDLAYSVPDEGTMVWTDNVCIPSGAPHPENAHLFLNHLLDAQVNAEIANTIKYATADKAAQAFIAKEDLENPAIYPPEEVIAKSESLVDVGEFTPVYDKAWTEIQAA
ncbi:MAG TPA: spermidine/putrescine ABC transporter substrate-binding protein [Hypericibacter adhaerens]|jgi:spermidine/putrescine transport system substrate-binding protein|uniref:Putrescine-binding periplasmic protein n=1 Tax=Hypericibacter adhaerens TaxID=2602016 RepID=A0A5J6N206_9PROT|nr:spermidine/putrescine ABC transporter substrate-binding protein [Hypericibacter adhaerens]QEX23741.1 putrescine-binding periplasmic protein [Hypericibacter adhaerens]HWA43358.1 spermidine/putrescine ABC transporter substrate-binding protein [Hypericibacter adhaerens]